MILYPSKVLINGARRVGKSFIAEAFARNEYRNYLLIDFAKAKDDPRVTDAFRLYLDDLDEFFRRLSVIYNMTFYERETLFIFDEVQMFPRAREPRTLRQRRRRDQPDLSRGFRFRLAAHLCRRSQRADRDRGRHGVSRRLGEDE